MVLSGTLDERTSGLATIKQGQGVTIVQDPADALYPGMPQSAINNVAINYVLSLADIPPLLVRLAIELVEELPFPTSEDIEYESDIVELDMGALENENRPGTPSEYVCPECGGSLWEITEDDILRFRCHVGHMFGAETLLAEQTDGLEQALWVALRALEDNAALATRITERARAQNRHHAAEQFGQQAQNAKENAKLIRDVLLNGILYRKSNEEQDNAPESARRIEAHQPLENE